VGRNVDQEYVVAEINLEGCPEGPVLQPLEEKDEVYRKYFAGWETPLAPWGGFGLDSGFSVVKDGDRPVLEWKLNNSERAIVAGVSDARDYRVVAEVKPIDLAARPHVDRADCSEAMIGIVFRVQTSRHHYYFGIEGRSRVVLYRRSDDEWYALAQQDIEAPDDFVTLEVALDGDGIQCKCAELGVGFFCTDTTFREGKAGVRGIGQARLASLKITQTQSQRSRDTGRWRVKMEEEMLRGAEVPDPVLVRTLDLKDLGGHPQFADFAQPDRYDMLFSSKERLWATTLEGEKLWELPIGVRGVVFSSVHTDHGRLIYGFAGERVIRDRRGITGAMGRAVVSDEMCVVRGSDGELVARAKIPPLEDAVQITAFTTTSGRLSGPEGLDVVLREWRTDVGNGGFNLWAYDKDLNLLWKDRVKTPYGHGYAVHFCDVDGDGRDEFLAGGTLYSSDGRVLWTHDLEDEMAKISGAQHYDAVAIGAFAEDESVDPVAFLLGGSAGVYVVDGRTGRTRMVHRVGHAQGRLMGRVRRDLPGQQILVACRWGNMGILNLFSGHGDRLWTIQPDYMGQGSCPVTWGDEDEQLIWMNTTGPVQALYNGHGQRVKDMPELQRLWGKRMRRDVGTVVTRMGGDPRELICLALDGKIYAFGPENL
jgi:hypothetical protein